MSEHGHQSPGGPSRRNHHHRHDTLKQTGSPVDGAGQAGPAGAAAAMAKPKRSMSVTDLAADHPDSWFDRALHWVPRILSSKPHIVVLMALGIYLIVLPLVGIAVSAKSELIGGNYTNVTSDIGACIAAGGTLHLVKQGRRRQKADEERLTLLMELHTLLHHLHPEAAAELGQVIGRPRADQPRSDQPRSDQPRSDQPRAD